MRSVGRWAYWFGGGVLLALGVRLLLAESSSPAGNHGNSSGDRKADSLPPVVVDVGPQRPGNEAADATPIRSDSSEAERQGIEYWRDRYREQLEAGSIVIRADEEAWTSDEESIRYFQARLQQLLDAEERELAVPSVQQQEWNANGERQALARLEEFHKGGRFQSVDAALIGGLLPDERFAFSLLVAESRSSPRLDRMDSIDELPPGTDPFTIPPEQIQQQFAPAASREARDLLAQEYRAALTEYLGCRGRLETLRRCARKAAKSEGLIPPHPNAMPRVCPEVESLEAEVQALRTRLLSAYVEAARSAREG